MTLLFLPIYRNREYFENGTAGLNRDMRISIELLLVMVYEFYMPKEKERDIN